MQFQNYTLELTGAARHQVLGLGEWATGASRCGFRIERELPITAYTTRSLFLDYS
jgi:hypothetical protein